MNIVIGIDGSGSSLQALEHLIGMARQWGGQHRLALISVQQPIVHADAFGITAGMDGPLLQQLGERDLESALDLAKQSGLDVTSRVAIGPSTQCIADYADELDADMIVLGTKGRSNLANVLVGSVANRMPLQSKRPVLLIPPAGDKT